MTITVHRDHETRTADWYGWRPYAADPCPVVLAGHRCRLYAAETCLCTSRVLDHLRRWTDRDGHPLVTAEPYDADGADIATLDAEPSALDLRLELTGRSPYYPGATLLLTIHARKEQAS